MSDKRTYRKFSDYLRYRKGGLSRKERYELERELETDPFAKDAMEGFERITADQLEEDVLSLHHKLNKRLKRRRRVLWYSIASSAASILIIGTIFVSIYELNPEKKAAPLPNVETPVLQEVEQAETGQEETAQEEAAQEEAGQKKVAHSRDVAETTPEAEPLPAPEAADQADTRVEGQNVAEIKTREQAEAETRAEAQTNAETKTREQAEAETRAQAERAVKTTQREVDAQTPVEKGGAPVAEEELDVVEVGNETEAPEKKEEVNDNIMLYAVEPEDTEEVEISRKASAPALKGRVRGLRVADAAPERHTINGIVVSAEDGQPVPGATVVIRGSRMGYLTDPEGRFKIESKAEQAEITASFIGMETEDQVVTTGKDNQITMVPDQSSLDEVVVVGQGVKESRLGYSPSGSVVTIDLEEDHSYNPPRPEGGMRALKDYVKENIRDPEPGQLKKRVVVLKLTVDESGRINEIKAVRSPGKIYEYEAIRLVKEGPAWEAADNQDGPVRSVVRVRIVFEGKK